MNRRLAEVLRDRAPEDLRVEIVGAWAACPFYNEELDGENGAGRRRAWCAGRSARPTACSSSPRSTTAPCRPCSATPSPGSRVPTVPGAIGGKGFAAVGTTPTPYGGKWSHEHARHSATIAGAKVIETVVLSQPGVEVDVAQRRRGAGQVPAPSPTWWPTGTTPRPDPRRGVAVTRVAELHDLTALEQGDPSAAARSPRSSSSSTTSTAGRRPSARSSRSPPSAPASRPAAAEAPTRGRRPL